MSKNVKVFDTFVHNNVIYWFADYKENKPVHINAAACFSSWGLYPPEKIGALQLKYVTFKMRIPQENFTSKQINSFCKDMASIFPYLEPVFGECVVEDEYICKTVTVSLDKSKQATFAFFTVLRYLQEFPYLVYRYFLFRPFLKKKVHGIYLSHLFWFRDNKQMKSENTNNNHWWTDSYGFKKEYNFKFNPENWYETNKYRGIFDILNPEIKEKLITYSAIPEKDLKEIAKDMAKKHNIYKSPRARKVQNEKIAAN